MIVGALQGWVLIGLALALFALEAWAFIDALLRKKEAFAYAGKRTKNFWLALTGAAVVIGFLTLPPGMMVYPVGIFSIAAVIIASIYLVDVRAAVRHYRPQQGGYGNPRGRW